MDTSVQNLALNVPAHTQDTLQFCAAEMPAIRHWLSQLPKANLGETARQLYLALQDLNQTRLASPLHLDILEQMRPSVHYTCQALGKHFLRKTVALDPREQKIANLSQALRNHLLCGYKQVILATHTEKQQKTNRLSTRRIDPRRQRRLPLALHRALSESCDHMLTAYQLYSQLPNHFWLELHTLYRLANQYQLLSIKIHEPEAPKSPEMSIEDVYKRALLMARSRPNMLRQMELQQLSDTLKRWSGAASIIDDCVIETPFVVDIAANRGPDYPKDNETAIDDNLRGLDTGNLINLLTDSLAQPNPADSTLTPPLPEHLTRHLLSAWSHKTSRKYNRQPTEGQLSFVTGFTACHFYLSSQMPFDRFLTRTMGYTAILKNQTAMAKVDRDVWSHVDNGTGICGEAPITKSDTILFSGATSKSQKTTTREHTIHQASLENMSPEGYCLRLTGVIPSQVQSGELIAVHDKTSQQWTLASIRWLERINDNAVLLGIQLLTPGARPGAVSLLSKTREQSAFMRCFLLPAFRTTQNTESLILPRVAFKPGNKIMLNNGHQLLRARLIDCLQTTGSYSHFTYRTFEQLAKQSQANKASGPDDDFSSIWTSL
ncbi:hypothetical protein GCM10023116_44550 [Kistimonas scapharcae]|uniref:GTPase n=1 Tax=Kistimonas scapharcae TaxID=1036133 RepID=A0ABP8V8W9_9GAMM